MEMNVLYCGDGNVENGVLLSVLSLCRVVRMPLHVFLLTAEVTMPDGAVKRPIEPQFAAFLQEQMRRYRPDHTVDLTDITALFAADPPTANMDTRFTPCCMLRLYADLVEALPDRVLYLDNDVVCRRDPTQFYAQDLTGHSLAGVPDYYGSHFFRRSLLRRDYLNSGVLLLDLKRIRENGLFAKCREVCRDKKMLLPDQSAINKLCRDKKICKRRYNDQRRLHKDTVFQHFTTTFRLFPRFHTVTVKPWNVDDVHRVLKLHEYDDLFDEYTKIKNEYETKETLPS